MAPKTWNAISAPPKTPAAIVAKLNIAINESLSLPAARARFRDLDILPGGGDPAAVRKFVADEAERWGTVVQAAGLAASEAKGR